MAGVHLAHCVTIATGARCSSATGGGCHGPELGWLACPVAGPLVLGVPTGNECRGVGASPSASGGVGMPMSSSVVP